MKIIATDEKGNTFEKTIVLSEGMSGPTVSLGWPCQWYLKDIIEPPHNGSDKMWLDAQGRNHKGSPVYCSHSELMEKVKQL